MSRDPASSSSPPIAGIAHDRPLDDNDHGEDDVEHHHYNYHHHHQRRHTLDEEEKEVADYDVRAGGHPIIEVEGDPVDDKDKDTVDCGADRSHGTSPTPHDSDSSRGIQHRPHGLRFAQTPNVDDQDEQRYERSISRAGDEEEGQGGTVSPCHSSDRTAIVSSSTTSPATPSTDKFVVRSGKTGQGGIDLDMDGHGADGTRTPADGTRTPGRSTYRDIGGFRYTVDHDPPLDPAVIGSEGKTPSTSSPTTTTPIVWVDFSPDSPSDPLHFPAFKKYVITTIACTFTFWTSLNASSYAIGEGSMERDLGASRLQAATGLSLYAWGFAVFPMVLAPFSEELGRRPLYVVAGVLYWVFYFAVAKANSIAVVLVFRFLQGGAGSVGSTLVGGSLADIWPASERGGKMAVFALMAVSGTAFAPVIFSWVEANPSLEWRWIQWIQIILVGVYLPAIPLFMPETRAAVLLKKQAQKMRKEKHEQEHGDGNEKRVVGGWDQGMKYLARGEVGKPKLGELMRVSLVRPIHLLATEPIVIFFTLWISIAWAVMYGLVQSIPYVFQNVYGFGTGRVGLVYLALTIGGLLGYALNFVQEHYYNTRVAKKGAEARLYGAMVAGIALACGCFIYAWTTFSYITYVAPCIGIAIIMAGVYTIYLACFNYLADGYSLYASSALAGQSLVRNLVGGSFPMFANPMYQNLNPNWASTLFGLVAALLAAVPFVGFFYGPQIRARSKFSKLLLEEERKAAVEKEDREGAMDPA